MKRIVAAFLLVLLLVSLASCNKDGVPDGMMDATAPGANYQLFVPETWVSQAESGISGAKYSIDDSSNVNLTTHLPDKAYTVTGYWSEVCLPSLETTFKDFQLVEAECKETTLGGRNAYQYVYVASLGGNSYQFMQLIAVYGDMVYTLTYTAKVDVFATHAEDVELIRSSFRFS